MPGGAKSERIKRRAQKNMNMIKVYPPGRCALREAKNTVDREALSLLFRFLVLSRIPLHSAPSKLSSLSLESWRDVHALENRDYSPVIFHCTFGDSRCK